jgi:rhamnogalacturonan II specific xylosyltransferase
MLKINISSLRVGFFASVVLYVLLLGYMSITRISSDRNKLFSQKKYYTNKTEVRNAIFDKKWIIMVSANSGYLDFFLNWFAAYKKLNLLYHIIVIAEDKNFSSYINTHKGSEMEIIKSEFHDIKDAVSFGSKQFNILSVRRHGYILKQLIKGSNVIFSDIDTVWLKNPIPYFNGNFDMWMQLDAKTMFCPGTMAIKSSEITVSFFKNLTHGLSLKVQADQPFINKLIRSSKINIAALPTEQFPSGRQYFKQFSYDERSKAVVVHNNWIAGHEAKRNRFISFDLWYTDK